METRITDRTAPIDVPPHQSLKRVSAYLVVPFDIADERTVFFVNDMAGVEEFKPRFAEAVSAAIQGSDVTNPIYRVITASILREVNATGDTERFILDRLELVDERLVALMREHQRTKFELDRRHRPCTT